MENKINIDTVETIKKNIANKISHELSSQKMSKRELARRVDVSANTIRNFLKGENINLTTAIRIDEALSLNIFKNI
jgi:plasmid maintenance system antidote protein VapI